MHEKGLHGQVRNVSMPQFRLSQLLIAMTLENWNMIDLVSMALYSILLDPFSIKRSEKIARVSY